MAAEIDVQREGVVTTVALNRPESHNAMTPTMITSLTNVFQRLAEDDQTRVVVLTGKGRSFCAGADLGFMRAAADFTFEENRADGRAIFDLMLAVDSCPRPVVGRVNGAAVGGGAGLVSCCDIVVAVERAKFAFSEARLGIAPAVISPFVLAKIGVGHGRELFMTGERFPAGYAHQIGLVHHVVADENALDEKVAERVEHLLMAASGAQADVKKLIRTVSHQPKAVMRDYTTEMLAQRRAADEGREGMSAFLEKRKPWWQN